MTTHAPTSETEACRLVAELAGAGTPVTIEGGGTKAAIGRPAQTESTLSSRGLSGITLYEPAELVIGAEAGTPLAEIVRTLADAGQQLAFEPMDHRSLLGTEGEPTIGGVAAANMSGPRRILAGAARDSLLGLRFVNGRGETVKSGGRVMKNVTGLDLVKLLAGSWGTLGFLTEVTFKAQPMPERVATLVVPGLDDARAVAALAAALGSPFEVSGAAHLPAGIGGEGARTLIRIEGFSVSVAYRLGEMTRLLGPFRPAEAIDDAQSIALWRTVRDVEPFATSRGEAVWRVSTGPTHGPVFTDRLAGTLAARWFYDWGGGLVWIACPAEGDAGASAIRAALRATGGHATLIRAPAEIRVAVEVFEPLDPAVMRLQAGIKAALDPAGVFNPGRMYAGV